MAFTIGTHLLQADSALLAASIASAILYLAYVRTPPSLVRMIIKTASTALLSATVIARNGHALLAGALALGSLGDAFLAWDGETAFLCGLTSFLASHVVYIKLFLESTGGTSQLPLALSSGPRPVAAGALVLLIVVMLVRLMPAVGRDMRFPVLVYSFAILKMALTALTLESGWATVGALMFTASDAILATDKFLVAPGSSYRGVMQYAVWVLYYSGQVLIALGFLDAYSRIDVGSL